jgi:hypothetical protein
MNYIKEYRIVAGLVIVIIILVLIRSTGMNHFQPDAAKHAESSLNNSNVLTLESFKSLTGQKLIIKTDSVSVEPAISNQEIRNIHPASLLTKENLKMIMKHKGPVVLTSSSPAESARLWMLLSQMGRKELYILDRDQNEVLKFTLRKDSL